MKLRGNKLLKYFDTYLGIPFIYIMGLFKSKKAKPDFSDRNKVYTFAIVKTAAMGDTILTSAIIEELHQEYPNSKIYFICTKNNLAFVKLLNCIDNIIVFDLKSPISSLFHLASVQCDCIFDFGSWPKIDAIITNTVKSKYSIGFFRPKMYRHYAYDKFVEHLDSLHEIDNYRSLLNVIFPVKNFLPSISIKDKGNLVILQKYIVLHMFPSGATANLRKWMIDNWVALAKELSSKFNYKIILTGSNDDEEEANNALEIMLHENIDCESYAGKTNLKELIGILTNASALVSVDTGVMHLGAALDIPVVGLHGPSNYKRWGALGAKSRPIQSQHPCSPCLSLGFDTKCKEAVCMQEITVNHVLGSLKELGVV